MNKNIIIFTLILCFSAIIGKGQTLNLNDCIKMQKSSIVEINNILQSKNHNWEFNHGMWSYINGTNTTFLRKTEGDLNNSEIILVTKNRDIIKTIYEDIKRYGMVQDRDRPAYIGKNYAVVFMAETNDNGEEIISIHIMPKSMY